MLTLNACHSPYVSHTSLCRRSMYKVEQMHTHCITLLKPFNAHLFCCKMQIDRVFHPKPKNETETQTQTCFKCLEDKRKLLQKNNGAYNVKQQKKNNKKYNKNKRICIRHTVQC